MADGRVRVRGREGEEVVWSRKAARRAGRLTNWLDDLDPSEDTIFPVEETCATVLRTLGAMCDDDWSVSCLDECSLTQLASLIEGASNLIAEQALEYAQIAFACRLDGKCANELRELLGALDDFESDEERVAALAEPAFTLNSPMPQHTAAAALPVNDDAAEAALGKVDVGTLIELKGLNRAWRALGRRALCSRLCRREGHADPRQLHEITELNLELLIEAGRPSEAARAGRLLHLERLTGYGFVVDVAAVRNVDLVEEEDEEEEEEEEDNEWNKELLRGPAKHALCSCVTGEGEPPLKLLLGAIACAGSGDIRGIPVEQMRAGTLTHLNLNSEEAQHGYGIGPEGAMLVAFVLPVMGSLTSLNLENNQLCGVDRVVGRGTYTAEGITAIADALRVNSSLTQLGLAYNLLCGIDENGRGTYTAEGITAIADALRVNSSLTSLDLENNQLCGVDRVVRGTYTAEGITAIADALRVNGVLTKCKLKENQLGVTGWTAIFNALCDSPTSKIVEWDLRYESLRFASLEPEIAKPLAEYISATGSLTSLSIGDYNLGDDGVEALSIGLKESKSLATLDLSNSYGMMTKFGPKGAAALASAIAVVAGSLTELDLSWNDIGAEGAKPLADALCVNSSLTEVNLQGNRLCGVWKTDEPERKAYDVQKGTYTDEGISALADALRVNCSLTSVNVGYNEIGKAQALNLVSIFKQKDQMKSVGLAGCDLGVDGAKAVADYVSVSTVLTELNICDNSINAEGVTAICNGVQGNKETKLASLNIGINNIGSVGGTAVAAMLAVTGSLTSLNLDANELGDEGISAIATLLKDTTVTRLASLDLRANEIGPKGAESLAVWLAVSGALTMCHLSMNHLGNDGAAALREAVKGRAGFELDLGDEPLD